MEQFVHVIYNQLETLLTKDLNSLHQIIHPPHQKETYKTSR